MSTIQVREDAIAYFPTEEAQERRQLLRKLVGRDYSGPEMLDQRIGRAPFPAEAWARLTGEIGVGLTLVPEELGGLGLGYEDFAGTIEELGRGLLAAPVLSSAVLAPGLLLPLVRTDSGNPAAVLLTSVANGETTVAVGFMDARACHSTADVGVRADRDGGTWRLAGVHHLVLDGATAQQLLVTALLDGELGVFSLPVESAVITSRPSIDPSRSLSTITLDSVPAELLVSGPAAEAALAHAVKLTRLALAAESLGGAEAALQAGVAYSLSRNQFGRPIGSFQAVKHRLANALLAIQSARAVVAYACWAWDDGSPESGRAVLAAKIAGTEAYAEAAAHAVQVHGAMGTTLESAVQVHFRRARFLSLFLGSNAEDKVALAGQLGFGD